MLAGVVAGIWALIFGAVHFIKQARKSGVDEISAGPVKVDFEDSNDSKVYDLFNTCNSSRTHLAEWI